MKLKDRVVLITGAGSGIGHQTALACAREGAKIVAVDLDEAAAAKTCAAIGAGDAIAVQSDVSRAADCARMVQRAEEDFGRLDVLFNNAGISHIDDDDAVNTEEDV